MIKSKLRLAETFKAKHDNQSRAIDSSSVGGGIQGEKKNCRHSIIMTYLHDCRHAKSMQEAIINQ